MTLADLIAEVEKCRPGARQTQDGFRRYCQAETMAARAMAKRNIHAVRVGSTFYIRYNNSLTAYCDVPEASSVTNVEDASNVTIEED